MSAVGIEEGFAENKNSPCVLPLHHRKRLVDFLCTSNPRSDNLPPELRRGLLSSRQVRSIDFSCRVEENRYARLFGQRLL